MILNTDCGISGRSMILLVCFYNSVLSSGGHELQDLRHHTFMYAGLASHSPVCAHISHCLLSSTQPLLISGWVAAPSPLSLVVSITNKSPLSKGVIKSLTWIHRFDAHFSPFPTGVAACCVRMSIRKGLSGFALYHSTAFPFTGSTNRSRSGKWVPPASSTSLKYKKNVAIRGPQGTVSCSCTQSW